MRNEVKFIGDYTQLRKIISEQSASRAYPTRSINSIYFDTRDMDDFNDSEEGSVPRQKTRLTFGARDRGLGLCAIADRVDAAYVASTAATHKLCQGIRGEHRGEPANRAMRSALSPAS